MVRLSNPRPSIILRWVTIWDPYILSFFNLAMIGRNIKQFRQICQILLFSWNFGKTQLSFQHNNIFNSQATFELSAHHYFDFFWKFYLPQLCHGNKLVATITVINTFIYFSNCKDYTGYLPDTAPGINRTRTVLDAPFARLLRLAYIALHITCTG